MSQIDLLNYIPHLFWFLVLFLVFYFIIFSYVLPLIYQTLKVRSLFLNSILSDSLLYDIFYLITCVTYNNNVFLLFVKSFINYLKVYRNVNNLRTNLIVKSQEPLLKFI